VVITEYEKGKYFVVNISKCLHTTLADFEHLAKRHFLEALSKEKSLRQ
jgi:hypothetical protein